MRMKLLLRLKSGKEIYAITPEIKLNEGESDEHWFRLSFYRDEINTSLDIANAEVFDSNGKKYVFHMSKLKR